MSDPEKLALKNALQYAKEQLSPPNNNPNYSFAQFTALNLILTRQQAKDLAITQFDEDTDGHALNRVKKWLGDSKWPGDTDTIYNRLKDSKEMLVLADLAYNSYIKYTGSGCPSLKAAILSGNRAEAWYEIRYNTGGSLQRRIAEAGIFGLYNDPAHVTKEDATMIYQMFTKHRDKMLSFEATNKTAIQGGQTILASNADLGTVQILKEELTPAATVLIEEYTKPEYGITDLNFNPLNIQVASDKTPGLIGEDTTDHTGSNRDLLIGEVDKGSVMLGGAGDDVLIGGNGNDWLMGGEGTDTMIGGLGEDTYYINGHDRIIDTGKNNIIWNGKLIAGVFELEEDHPGMYRFKSDDGEYSLVFHSPGQLTLSATDSITFVNQTSAAGFANDDFGISLTEEIQTPFDRILTGTADRDEMGLIANGNNSQYWQLTYTSFPDGETGNTPFYQQYLAAEAPRMQITGGVGGDFLFGFARHDEISGGDDGDIIFGNLGSWNGKPVTMTGEMEGDTIDGGAGDDWLQGAGESDQVIGGAGNDLLSGFNGDDILWGDADNDVLAGGSHADSLAGGDGDDILLGDGYITGSLVLTLDNLASLGFDLTGPTGGYYTGYTTRNFTLHNDAPNSGDDILFGGAGRDWLEGGAGADMLDGGTNNDSLFGGEGDDFLNGGDGNDWLVGDNGDLTGTGDDIMAGGKGDDIYVINNTGDIVIEEANEGIDIVRSSVNFALPDNVEYIIFTGGGDVNATGNALDNLLSGTDGANILSGNGGNDTLNGFAGNDILEGGEGLDWMTGGLGNDTYLVDNTGDVVVENVGEGLDTVQSTVSYNLAANLENLVLNDFEDIDGTGNELDNVLVGNSGANILSGADGNDSLQGGAGDDTLSGGVGNDTLSGGSDNDILAGGEGDDVFRFGIGDGQDTIMADDYAGKDTLVFGQGIALSQLQLFYLGEDLVIKIGNADDQITLKDWYVPNNNGYYRIDSFSSFSFTDGEILSSHQLSERVTVYGTPNDDILTGLNMYNVNFNGGAGNDELYGDGGDDILAGGPGNDILHGGYGNNIYRFNLGDGFDTVVDSWYGDNETLEFGPGVVLSDLLFLHLEFDLVIKVGDTGDGIRLGDWYNNMYGDIGVDRFVFADQSVLTRETVLAMNPIVGTDGADTLLGSQTANDWLDGAAGNDVISGKGGADCLQGGDGNDLLQGDAGNDDLAGGPGDDIFQINLGDGKDTIWADDMYGIDTVSFGTGITLSALQLNKVDYDLMIQIGNAGDQIRLVDWYNPEMTMYHLDRFIFADGTVLTTDQLLEQQTVYGSAANDIMSGTGTVNDRFDGGAGDDFLSGNDGNDILSGGAGNDTLSGGAGDDTFMFNLGDGQDTIASDDIVGTDTLAFGPGISLANIQVVMTDTNLILKVGDVGDQLTLLDWYNTISTGYRLNRFSFADGTVLTRDNLLASGTVYGTAGADVMSGIGAENDWLDGSLGNDILQGNAGNDILTGGAGSDTLWGGTGNDIFRFNLGDGQDIIMTENLEDIDTLAFGAGISLSDLKLIKANANNLVIKVGNTGDQVTLANWYNLQYAVGRMDRFSFADGTVLSREQLLAQTPVHGTEGDDQFDGYGWESDWFVGGSGNDILRGNNGNDILVGGPGNDIITGGEGHDKYLFNLGDGQDAINWGSGCDYYKPNPDSLVFGVGITLADLRLVKPGGYLVIEVGTSGDQVILPGWYSPSGTYSRDGYYYHLNSFGLADGSWLNLRKLMEQKIVYGTDGNDSFFGTGIVNDRFDGGAGDDWICGDRGVDHIEAGGNDYLIGGAGNDTLLGVNDNDTLMGDTGNDYLDGGVGDDTLLGGDGADVLIGSNGTDILDGGVGADTMLGGLGNDTFVVDDLADVVTENTGEGIDSVQANITYTLSANLENLSLSGTLNINGIGNELGNKLIGNSGENILAGGAGSDTLYGGTGADTLMGGLGNDTFIIDDFTDVIIENANEGMDTAESSISYSLGNDVENITLSGTQDINGTGNALDNVLIGNSGTNALTGGAGNDTLNGGAGADTLMGGIGNDTFIVDDFADVVTENANEGIDTVESSISYTLGANLENLTLTGASDVFGTGNELDNVLIGNNAANILNGGLGVDTLLGGLGNDTFCVDNVGDIVIENLYEGSDTILSNVSYSLGANLENLSLTGTSAINGTGNMLNNILFGNSAINTLTGDAGNDTLDGGAGADLLFGGSGDDVYVVDDFFDVLSENVGEGIDTVRTGITYTLGNNVENLILVGTSAINGTGNALSNILIGNSAANTLDGSSGVDSMFGGRDNDIYQVDDVGDIVTEYADEGLDRVQAGVTYTLAANVENLTLVGTSAINGTGNTLDNILIGNSAINTLTGGAGNDTLDGGAGADKMLGGLGDDTYFVDIITDVITENSGQGTDTVRASITYTLAANVENLTLTGTSAINGTGNSLNNLLIGNSAANTLNGKTGADSLFGGLGNDIYVIDNTGDIVTEYLGEGADTVQSGVSYILTDYVENLTLTGTSAINGTGNSFDNILVGNSGANTLTGGAGNDTLNGGAGVDKMLGGLGNDTYVVDVATDVITENAGEGSDTVQTAITYILGANVDNLTLTGTSAINGTGNSLDNALLGNSAANTLNGGTGNDSLNGTLGNDTLTGGAGNDIFVFDTTLNATSNKDTLSDFTAGQDKIQLDKDIFSSLTATGTLSAAFFKASSNGLAGDNNDYFLYNTTSGALLYDSDGNGQGVAVQFATLNTKPTITTNDFLVVA